MLLACSQAHLPLFFEVAGLWHSGLALLAARCYATLIASYLPFGKRVSALRRGGKGPLTSSSG